MPGSIRIRTYRAPRSNNCILEMMQCEGINCVHAAIRGGRGAPQLCRRRQPGAAAGHVRDPCRVLIDSRDY